MSKRKRLAALFLCPMLLFGIAGCDDDVMPFIPQNKNLVEESVEQSTPQLVADKPAAEEPLKAPVGAIENNTRDMTIELLPEHYVDGYGTGGNCAPGEMLALESRIDSFGWCAPGLVGTQQFLDLYFFGANRGENVSRFVFAGDGENGYTMDVYEEANDEPVQCYLLEGVQNRWQAYRKGQILFMTVLPDLPMEEILVLYPGAVLPYGMRESWGQPSKEYVWPDLYSTLLWAEQPLYNLQTGSTNFAYIDEDGNFKYAPVDWQPVADGTLRPGEPILLPLYSVGSGWHYAVRFEDAGGNEYTYLAGEDGRGGDWYALPFWNISDVEFLTWAEWEAWQVACPEDT